MMMIMMIIILIFSIIMIVINYNIMIVSDYDPEFLQNIYFIYIYI